MSSPCFKCGVNAWLDCKHRPGEPKPDPSNNPKVWAVGPKFFDIRSMTNAKRETKAKGLLLERKT